MHPVDPLAVSEIEQAVATVKADRRWADSCRLPRIALREPPKDEVRAHHAGELATAARMAELDIFDLQAKTLAVAAVDLETDRIVDWEELPGAWPGLMDEEKERFEPLIRRDRRWLEAVTRRGIDPDTVRFEYGTATGYLSQYADRSRIVFAAGFVASFPTQNYYAHPIDGLVAIVDVNTGEVLDVLDDHRDPPVPAESGEFSPEAVGAVREDLRPLDIVQPEGASFCLDGRLLTWQRWSMRIGFHPVEGLVLHQIAYDDQGERRPILYRAALSEMVVPYADTSVSQFWRSVFDAGEVGLGQHANSLELGCDCLGVIQYLDAVVADTHGRPKVLHNAICIHEEDYGIGWKHDGVHVATTEVRRQRRLVVSFFATVGNYDYGFYWYFSTDGSIEVEIKLTGIIYTAAARDGELPAHGEFVAPNLYGPHHQHLFCFRLDFEIDGPSNIVHQVDVAAPDDEDANPYGSAFVADRTPILTEDDSGRLINPTTSRYWTISSSQRTNRHGWPTEYKLIPQSTPALFAKPDAPIARSAGFATKNLWVTPYADEERYAAGAHPAFGDTGLADWVRQGRETSDTDLVVWHTVGTTHIVRPEDWPVMPVDRIGFALKPYGFFDRNPALDMPPGALGASRHADEGSAGACSCC